MSSIDNAADKNLKTSPAPAKGNVNSTGNSRSSASAAGRDAVARALAAALPFWGDLTEGQKTQLAAATRPLMARAGERVQGGGSGCAGVVVALASSLRALRTLRKPEKRSRSSASRLERPACSPLPASCP